MGKAKRTRIPQRMSQHIMQLKIALFIVASTGITYQDDMFIAHRSFFVNTFLSVGLLFFFPASRQCMANRKSRRTRKKVPRLIPRHPYLMDSIHADE